MRLFFLALPVLLLVAGASGAERIGGHGCVDSANVLRVGCGDGPPVRLWGIDGPEPTQICRSAGGADYACGEAAAGVLRDLIGSTHVVCSIRGRDLYGRPLGTCRAGGLDVGAELVRRGWATVYGGTTAYKAQEAEARAAKRGLWSGSFDPPRKWRQATTGKED